MNYIYASDTNPPHFFVCGNLISNDGFLHCRRVLNCNVLISVLEGTLYITQAERSFAVSAGQYIFLRADEEHYGHKASDGRLSYMWVHFKSDAAWETLSDDLTSPPDGFAYLLPEYGTLSCPQRANMLFRQLMDFSRQEKLYTNSILSCSLSLLLMELTQEFLDGLNNRSSHISPVVSSAAEWIKSNCHRQLSIHDIAEEFHYNAEYLSALFKKETGLTLIQYLNRSRIDISKNLLSNNDISIKEAAYSCGFKDEKYYMKMFKKSEGMTPLQYKNAFHKKRIN
ncbi:MAG: AraC family transcriptional regulator [Ruminococcus sp.]|nr:AraC family transcriptional regulator [Ruminococcus sp.]